MEADSHIAGRDNGRSTASVDPQASTTPNSKAPKVAKSAAAQPEPVPPKKKTPRQPPKRGALRIGRIKHAGDWDLAPRAIPNMMEFLENPPFSLTVDINEKAVFPRDPNLPYPLLYLHGRNLPPFDKTDLECLRRHLDPGCGTIFADAHASNPEFDASFRRFVKDLCPDRQLVPIPKEDELFTNKVVLISQRRITTRQRAASAGIPSLRVSGSTAIGGSSIQNTTSAACSTGTQTLKRKVTRPRARRRSSPTS